MNNHNIGQGNEIKWMNEWERERERERERARWKWITGWKQEGLTHYNQIQAISVWVNQWISESVNQWVME